MIVSEGNVSDALAYLADDPHPIARAKKDLTDAENDLERIKAEVYREQEGGSIKDKEAAVNCSTRVIAARDRFSEYLFEFERHKANVKSSEMIIEVWRSENANARAAERIR